MRWIHHIIGWAWSILLLAPPGLHAQTQIDWQTLADVEYKTIYDEEAGYVYMKPIFGETLQSLNGKEVHLKGYVLPMDVEGSQYALSAFPYSSCFFCGGGSKESVVELSLANKKADFELDQVITIKGKLHLNKDQFGLNYTLLEAKRAD